MFTPNKYDKKLELIWSPLDNAEEFASYEDDISLYKVKNEKTKNSRFFKT